MNKKLIFPILFLFITSFIYCQSRNGIIDEEDENYCNGIYEDYIDLKYGELLSGNENCIDDFFYNPFNIKGVYNILIGYGYGDKTSYSSEQEELAINNAKEYI